MITATTGTESLAQPGGALNAGFAFFVDCVVNLFILAALLRGTFGFPSEVVFGTIVPGCAVAILAGNVLLDLYTRTLVRQSGNQAMTTIPIGLDIATTFAMAFLILGPVYLANEAELGAVAAGELAWQVGVAVTFWIGLIKLLYAQAGELIQRIVPTGAAMGTLSGIALAWMGAEAVLGIFQLPEIGLLALGVMIYALMAGHRLPLKVPGALAAIGLGTLLFYAIALSGLSPSYQLPLIKPLGTALPDFALSAVLSSFDENLIYLGVALPLALLSSIGCINIVRAALLVGDQYGTRSVLRIDAAATLIGALFGGVVQTTAYLGHATYKRMGARQTYTLVTGAVIVFLALGGGIGFAASAIPDAVLKSILIVVAADIVRVSFLSVESREAPSFLFALIPAVFALCYSKLEVLFNRAAAEISTLGGDLVATLDFAYMDAYLILGALSRGYILTSMVWATMVTCVIERRMLGAATVALLCSGFSLVGLIHSVAPSSAMYLPWMLDEFGRAAVLPWRFAGAYLLLALLFLALSRIVPAQRTDAHGVH
ncbi:MAG: hypothetical protein AAGG11_14620 [Pseudomonadota bacterium]